MNLSNKNNNTRQRHSHHGRDSESQQSPNASSYGQLQDHSQITESDSMRQVDPNGVIPANLTFNPTKPTDQQSIFDRWMIAQIQKENGEQPPICIDNNVTLKRIHRTRTATTYITLQRQLDQNTDIKLGSNLAAGDFTDDEDEELSGMYPGQSPRSQNSPYSFTPTPSDGEEDSHSTATFTSIVQQRTGNAQSLSINTQPKLTKKSQSNTHVFRGRRQAKFSVDEGNQTPPNLVNRNGHSLSTKKPQNGTHNSSSMIINHHSNQSSSGYEVDSEQTDTLSPLNMNNSTINTSNGKTTTPPGNSVDLKDNLKRTMSTDAALNFKYDTKKNLNKRRRKKSKGTVKTLWFRSQAQLKQGRNPTILAKYNIKLMNIRQHNPRYKDYERRRSHHEKAATYLEVTGDRLTHERREHVDGDDDDMSDTEDMSAPNTPMSVSESQSGKKTHFNYSNFVD